jgi:hypothetical protein
MIAALVAVVVACVVYVTVALAPLFTYHPACLPPVDVEGWT